MRVVGAVWLKDGEIFIAQRGKNSSNAGLWEFPGGKVENGESDAEALRRELFEELTLEVLEVGEKIASVQSPEFPIDLILYPVLTTNFDFELTEHDDAKFVSSQALRNISLTPADTAMLDKVLNYIDNIKDLYTATPEDLRLPCRAGGEHIFTRLQRPWLDADGVPALGALPLNLLRQKFRSSLLRQEALFPCADGSTRVLMRSSDNLPIEAVHMPRTDLVEARVTFCISSQIGCAMACAFCATGTLGLKRNLGAGEIVAQVRMLMSIFNENKAHSINLVFMGMGEPLQNVDNVKTAIRILCHPLGLGIPDRRITVSTCGITPNLLKLADAPYRPNLAISLNAPDSARRSEIMPVNRLYPLHDLLETLKSWPFRGKEKILFEYVMIDDFNTDEKDAEMLAALVKDFPHNVNLIPYNETKHASFRTPSPETVERFAGKLESLDIFVTIRKSRGNDNNAACGQLAADL